MAYRRRAGGGKRDAAEPAIIQALKASGCQVWQLGGTGLPDLLVKRAGRYYVFEVKTGNRRLTANQDESNWPVLRSVEDAMREVKQCPYCGHEGCQVILSGSRYICGGRPTMAPFGWKPRP